MIQKSFVIKSASGLNSRASTSLVAKANQFKSDIFFYHQSENANAKSIMNVMSLIITANNSFTITCSGSDEFEALEALSKTLVDLDLL